MYLTARILFLNEEDYLPYAIRSIYPVVDAIVIVEGCIREYGMVSGRYTEEGLSVDNSALIVRQIQEYEDPDRKVIFVQHGFASNYGVLANHAIDLIPRQTTHFLNVDADEIYSPQDIQSVKDLFEAHPRLCGVAVDRIHFYLDFGTVRKNRKASKLGPIGGTMFRKYYKEEYYPGKNAEHNPFIGNQRLMSLWFSWHGANIKEGIDQANRAGNQYGISLRRRLIPQFHYGWVRHCEKMLERVMQTYRRVDAYSGKNQYTEMTDGQLAEHIQTYHPVWTGMLSDAEELVPFEGEHPDVMKKHPFYWRKREKFGWL